MQYEMQIFETENHNEFRTLNIDGEPWFVLADVCRALELKMKNGSFSHHAEKLDDDEKRLVARSIVQAAPSPLKGEGVKNAPVGASLICLNEPGLYSLVLSSKKPEAKRFKKWVTSEVLPSIRKTGGYKAGRVPAFIRRFNANWDRVTPGYFSVISELAIRLHGRLEMLGHVMADRAPDGKELRPDTSVGRVFSDWLTKHHPTLAGQVSYYTHTTPEWEGPAKQYPTSVLHLYLEFIDKVWLPKYGAAYFKTRDRAALAYLPKLLPPPAPKPGMIHRPAAAAAAKRRPAA